MIACLLVLCYSPGPRDFKQGYFRSSLQTKRDNLLLRDWISVGSDVRDRHVLCGGTRRRRPLRSALDVKGRFITNILLVFGSFCLVALVHALIKIG